MASTADLLASLDAPLQAPVLIPLDDIEPDPENTRSTFRAIDGIVPDEEQEALEDLANDIDENKLHHPVSVIELQDGRYRLVIGERRWRAFRLNRDKGKPHYEAIPAFVRSDLQGARVRLAQMSENIQREDVSDLDIAKSLKDTLEKYPELQKQQLAKLLKKPPSYISRLLALMDPRWAHVVHSGLITYASLLEQFRTLPEEKRTQLVAKAKEEKRTITSGDIAKARKVPESVQRDVQSVLSAFAPKGEHYEPAHAAATRQKADAQHIVDHGGEPVIPSDVQFNPAPLGHFDVRLTLAQVAMIAKMDGFAEGSPGLSQTVTLALSPEAIRDALISIGGEAPKADSQLPMALINRANSFFS
jgi:ParB family chromosome partitioning protein